MAQPSLRWAFGKRRTGIEGKRGPHTHRPGAEALWKYVRLLKADGANLIFVAMHIYKRPMEPQIGNERLALAALLRRGILGVKAGPDVWEPTKRLYPKAFAADRVHPNGMGAEVMAQHWFACLLAHDGLVVPAWSREEMQQAIQNPPPEPAKQRHRRRRKRP